ncbi:putative alpha/beta hydrolase [Aspergillus clavatus NRRL 1]|uniref:Alpha/beta fold family hydrolase, putative n=1 Tax=Aspergillus clavatus (strain ATCC 1007 / CBS 513.65 / DSM 816 / NCTC 3887 / NRRL 1 / QM 1276 / 107) TaxID=344612 RepID=A1CS44_ASPCL|nr:alpha/beta fold family hydrolase, putative [Aspergillus clavatus NRRL 1]EAW08465.1 alpha/beta fold family hydrolase, putative [Aspergillus clavatus NRRL 1]
MVASRLFLRGASGFRAFSTSRILQSELSYQAFGPEKEQASRSPILFLHGLFGSKQNNRSISKALARDLDRQVFTLDLRNHGHSFHHPEHNYSAMADDVEKFIHQHDLAKCILIGHSMGAKTAMTVALRSSDLVSALIPVDNAPVNAPLKSDFGKYVRGMQEVESQKVTKQSDADKILREYEEALPIRQFLLTNLIRGEDNQTMKFRIPLSVLGPAIPAMADFPFSEPGSITYDGPTLFVRGTRSKYVSDDTIPAIKKFFPNAEIADVEAGHWLISENPEAFRQAVVKFLKNVS